MIVVMPFGLIAPKDIKLIWLQSFDFEGSRLRENIKRSMSDKKNLFHVVWGWGGGVVG